MFTAICTRARKNFCCSLLMSPSADVCSPGTKLMLYSFSFRLKVRREMPSCSAASVRWPPVRSRALIIICSSMLSRLLTGIEAVWRNAAGSPVSAALSREKSMSGVKDSMATFATRLRNSLILPGQACESNAEMACGEKFLPGAFRRRKCSASATISSGRSRNGGTRS